MTSEGRDEVRVLDQLVDVADEGAASHVAAGDLVDRNLHLRPGHCVEFGDKVCDPCLLEDCLDADVIPFRGVERQELAIRKTGIPVDDFLRHAVERNDHGARILLNGLRRDVFNCAVDDIMLLQPDMDMV